MRAWISGLALIAAACTGGTPPPPDPDPATRLSTPQGGIIGYIADSGAYAWQAIPFAAPPTGDLRWRAPRPAGGWESERQAVTPSEPCPQLANGLSYDNLGVESGTLVGSEDCLYLDVYAPPNAEDLPVMMWIHGGSNTWGWADQYDGSQLAMDQNVVVVVVQYRLGPLGFFSHPVLRETAAGDRDRAANFATLDQIAALEWIRDNIASYGGDAGTVTIFGESAGGHNVAALLGSPLAEGLFHRAIIQSGSASALSVAEAEGREGRETHPSLQAATDFAGENAGLEALQSADLASIYDAYAAGSGRIEVPTVIADGITIPAGGLMSAYASPETFNAVPVITGTNRDEMKLFNALQPELVNRQFGFLFRIRNDGFYEAINEYQSRMWAINAVDEIANAMVAGGHDDVWAYRFDWDEGGSNFVLDSPSVFGAMHALEIPFVFNNFEFFGDRLDPILFNNRNRDSREALAAEMGAYWGRFARQGDPGEGWDRWSDGAARIRFDAHGGAGSPMLAGEFTIPALAADLAADDRISDAQRCIIVSAMEGRYLDDGREVRALAGCGS